MARTKAELQDDVNRLYTRLRYEEQKRKEAEDELKIHRRYLRVLLGMAGAPTNFYGEVQS